MRSPCSASAEMLGRHLAVLRNLLIHLPRAAASALSQGPRETPPRRRLGLALLVACPAALAAGIVMPRLAIVMSPSIEAWVVTERPGKIGRGDYVRFTLRHSIAGPAAVQVTKHALCLPGDRLETRERPSLVLRTEVDGWYFCNGEFLGASMSRAHNGMRLDHLRWSGVIPPGMAYVGSRHPRGFDSRYFGLVPIGRLMRMERVL